MAACLVSLSKHKINFKYRNVATITAFFSTDLCEKVHLGRICCKASKNCLPPTGLEPAIPGLGGRCLIHWATEAYVVVHFNTHVIRGRRFCKFAHILEINFLVNLKFNNKKDRNYKWQTVFHRLISFLYKFHQFHKFFLYKNLMSKTVSIFNIKVMIPYTSGVS